VTFFQGASEIIIYILLLSPLMPEGCSTFASLIYEEKCNTHGFLLSKQLFLTMPSHSQLISSLFKIYVCI